MGFDFSNFENAVSPQRQNSGVFARFYDKQVRTGQIKPNGLPEFETKLYIEIKIKDERDVFDQPASVEHIERFGAEYNRYLKEKKEILKGTPLHQFAFLSPDQIECCRLRGVYTVEVLAELNNEAAEQLDLTEEKTLAKTFLEVSKNNKNIASLIKKEKVYLTQIETLKKELNALRANDNDVAK